MGIKKLNVWTGVVWLRVGTGVSSFECHREPSGFVEIGKFVDSVNNC
jgi:hypothetical protein